ncbi:MAG TPA: potassium-transporting ATPase subunit C [Solirubrobacterales bacterium]|nr:potassium-transporting ATPase subunit C [Solirubrobacterales bacterium]
MIAHIRTAVIAVVAFTLALGLAYPLLSVAGSQLISPNGSDGSQITRDGEVVGSRLIGQSFAGELQYFQSRPSQSHYSANATFFSNYGPNGEDTKESFDASVAKYLKREGEYTPGLTAGDIPPSAVMTSASGIDPHIDPDDARIQANRVAEIRGLDLDRVLDLIDEYTDGRALGILGDPGVNVLELNLALDREEN